MRKRNGTKSPQEMSKLCSQFGDVVSVVEKMRRQFSDKVIIQIPEEVFEIINMITNSKGIVSLPIESAYIYIYVTPFII